MKIINASINLSKIPKSKITLSKSGESWLNISIVLKDEKDKFDNDTAIQVQQTKEERETKNPIVYLGNGKTAFDNKAETKPKQKEEQLDNDLPF
jgi:hypothetical protein